ncbi:MAG: hypothetical protein IPJ94_16890 [Chloroflexi bacterium]|nr:hypothetical protein [Chloroflexota bacterium]
MIELNLILQILPRILGVSCTGERLMGQEITAHGKRPFLPPHTFSTMPPSANGWH